MAKIKPLYDRVVIKLIEEAEEKTPSGIIIPDTAKEKPQVGEVIAAGEGRITDSGSIVPLKVKEGDKVFFSKYAGNDVVIDGEEFIVVREDDIFAIIE